MTRWLRRPAARRLAGTEAGAAAADFALVFPVFFLLLFATLEFARAFWNFNSLQYVVSQSVRYAMTTGTNNKPTPTDNCSTSSLSAYKTSITNFVTTQLGTYLPSTPAPIATVTVANCTTSPATVTVTVLATYSFSFILSSFTPWGPITLRQQAVVTTPLS